ncbi:MAG: hypothetical protein WC829_17200 [Hyphomicrobium sp.]|jgi:hypothetical protein
MQPVTARPAFVSPEMHEVMIALSSALAAGAANAAAQTAKLNVQIIVLGM